jgi:hypothetical protein
VRDDPLVMVHPAVLEPAGALAIGAAGLDSTDLALPWPSVTAAEEVAARAVPGAVLFARYAFGPNRLGYCGPDDPVGLLERAAEGSDLPGLRSLAQGFEGAWPYLALIAESNGVPDPLDRSVVEAYWLGNPLLHAVGVNALHGNLSDRFRPRLRPDAWRWLETKAPEGAKPVHAFHVLDVFPRVGLMRSGELGRVLEVLESCRIRWGRVEANLPGERVRVAVVPLELRDGKLALGEPRSIEVQAWRGGAGFLGEVHIGDVVSVHWDWLCDRLTPRQAGELAWWTRHHVAIANQTL